MKALLKDAVFAGLTWMRPNLGTRASILMYHSVGNNPAFFTVKPEVFERQLQYLVEKKFTFLKLTELIERLEKGESIANTVCVTFDDGYADNYEAAFPLLKKYRVPMSLFLTTGLVGKTFTNSEKITLPMLTSEHIQEMKASGLVEFLPHGALHKKLHKLSREEAQREIEESVHAIRALNGIVPTIFAYPSGRYTEETIKLLKDMRMHAAVTINPGLVRSFEKPFELPRNAIDSKTSFIQFRAKLSGAIDAFLALR